MIPVESSTIGPPVLDNIFTDVMLTVVGSGVTICEFSSDWALDVMTLVTNESVSEAPGVLTGKRTEFSIVSASDVITSDDAACVRKGEPTAK